MYNSVFPSNVRLLLDEQNMSLKELAARSGISAASLSAILSGKGNPCLSTMSAIAQGLEIPLASLFEPRSPDDPAVSGVTKRKTPSAPYPLPPGYERVSAVVTEFQAFVVRKWAAEAAHQPEMIARN